MFDATAHGCWTPCWQLDPGVPDGEKKKKKRRRAEETSNQIHIELVRVTILVLPAHRGVCTDTQKSAFSDSHPLYFA